MISYCAENMKIRIVFLTAIYFLFFCGIYRHDVEKEEYLALAHQPAFDCVGRVLLNGHPQGSCVLIGERYVLSAAHVFKSIIKNGNTTYDENSSNAFTVFFGENEYRLKKLVIHPAYDIAKTKHGDIALLELTREVTDAIPAFLNSDTTELRSIITCVGYGPARPAKELEHTFYYGRIAGQNIVDSVGGETINGLKSLLAFDFDNPESDKMNRTGSSTACTLEYIPGGGDSGGGVFIEYNGKWKLAGIVSRGVGSAGLDEGWYGSICFATRLAAFKKWIEANIANPKK